MFQIPLRDPRVFFGRVSLPSDQEGMGRRSSAVAYDLFNFIFFFSIDKVRGWRGEVLSMDFIFAIRRQERSVEDRMDLPSFREVELIHNR